MSAKEFTEEELFANARAVIKPSESIAFRPDDLLRSCAAAHGVTVEQVRGRSRRGPVAAARFDFYHALRVRGWSYPAIGEFVGRDYSTIKQVLSCKDRKRK